MTFKAGHFSRVAGLLKQANLQIVPAGRCGLKQPVYNAHMLVNDLCELFGQANPSFDRNRFIKAAGFDQTFDDVVMGEPVVYDADGNISVVETFAT